MDNENERPLTPASGSGPSNGGGSAGGAGGAAAAAAGGNPRVQVSQMSLYERQAVQALQALQRQPNAAAQYLQQMYAVQHQQMMLQQHLTSAQLQSLQVTLAATRQATAASGSGSETQGPIPSPATVNLPASSCAPLTNRTQTVSATVSGSLSGSCSGSASGTPTLTPSQAKMYLQTQLPQSGSLLQVARTLTRNVPLGSQLILMPGNNVSSLPTEGTGGSGVIQADPPSEQAHNLAVRTQGPVSVGKSPSAVPQPPPVSLSQAVSPVPQPPGLSHAQPGSGGGGVTKGLGSGPVPGPAGVRPGEQEAGLRKVEGESGASCGINLTRSVSTAGPLQASASSFPPMSLHHSMMTAHVQQKPLPPPARPGLGLGPQGQGVPGQTLLVPPMSKPQGVLPSRAPGPKVASVQASGPAQASGLAQASGPAQASGLAQASGPAQASGLAQASAQATGPGPVQHSTASTQTPALGLEPVPQAPGEPGQPQLQASSGPHNVGLPPQHPLPLKPPALGVKRKAEVEEAEGEGGEVEAQQEEEEKVFTEGSVPSTLDPPQLTPNQPPTPQDLKLPSAGKVEPLACGPPVLTSISNLQAPPLLRPSGRISADLKPPQAIVKPHILTHFIEGFVIQEGAEPFPVDSSLSPPDCKLKQQEPPILHAEPSLLEREPPLPEGSEVTPEMLTCEFCGRLEQADKFKRSKRFCSMACAKRYNVSCRKGVRRFTVDRQIPFQKDPDPRTGRRSTRKGSTEAARGSVKRLVKDDPAGRVSDSCCYDETLSPVTQLRQSLCDREAPELIGGTSGLHSASPGQWTVQQVHQFISSLPGCRDLAEDFQAQEIDGQALLLLKEEHLMTAMNIKLGPALKICAQINMLKEV